MAFVWVITYQYTYKATGFVIANVCDYDTTNLVSVYLSSILECVINPVLVSSTMQKKL